jgi:DNA polymerase-1
MIAVEHWCGTGQRGARLIMQVHDELVLEVEESRVAEVTAAIRGHMVDAGSLSVPLKVDVGTGANWDEAH